MPAPLPRSSARRPAAALAAVATLAAGVGLATTPGGTAGAAPTTASTAVAPSGGTIAISPTTPIVGEQFKVSGNIGTKVVRLVYLQHYVNRQWKSFKNVRTAQTGAYAFTVSTTKVTGYRAYAPKTTVKKKVYPAVTTGARYARPVKQTGSVRVLPQIAQPGPTPAAAGGAKSVVVGRFTPTRAARPTTLQRQVNGKWATVAKGTENTRGESSFTAPYLVNGKPAVYRVVLSALKGAPTVTTKALSTAVAGKPSFVDEFTGTKLSPKWRLMDPEYNSVPNRKCSKGAPAAVQVAGGVVTLKVMKDPRKKTKCQPKAGGPQYSYRLNGNISTRGVKSFKYGVAAARVKFQRLRGQHGAFWMWNGTNAKGAEVDIAEWFGQTQPSTLANFVWKRISKSQRVKYGQAVKNVDRFLTGKSDSWTSRYHVFSLEWTPTAYIFYIDGQETWRTSEGLTSKPMVLWLSLLSGDYELKNIQDSQLPQQMSVDWVKFWPKR